jgi:hypothetical protein
MFKDAEVSNRRQGEEMWAVLAFMYEPIIILLILDYERMPANSLIPTRFWEHFHPTKFSLSPLPYMA